MLQNLLWESISYDYAKTTEMYTLMGKLYDKSVKNTVALKFN